MNANLSPLSIHIHQSALLCPCPPMCRAIQPKNRRLCQAMNVNASSHFGHVTKASLAQMPMPLPATKLLFYANSRGAHKSSFCVCHHQSSSVPCGAVKRGERLFFGTFFCRPEGTGTFCEQQQKANLVLLSYVIPKGAGLNCTLPPAGAGKMSPRGDVIFSSSPSAVVQHNHHHQHNQYIHQKQQHHQQKQKQYQKQQLYAANDSFFTKAPLGCLSQSEQQQSCEPEPIAEDGFFTPVLPKPLRKGSSPTTTTRSSSTSSTITTKPTSAPQRHGTTFSRRTKVPTIATEATTKTTTTAQQKQTATSPARSASPLSSSTSTTTSTTARPSVPSAATPVAVAMASSAAQVQLAAGVEHRLHHRQRVRPIPGRMEAEHSKEDDKSNYYEPRGGWPLRTRTWPDGRRVGPDGKVLKWQKLRPKVPLMPTTTTTASSTTTAIITIPPISSSSTTTTASTTTTRRTPMPAETVAKGVPGLHFTFVAPQLTRRPPTVPTPSARFSVAPNDPTLYAVRPTTPMNGLSLASSTPTSISMDTASNQLGDDKKLLIGVGSLSIVVMVGAILLCVFCKRCNSLCSQLANAAGAAGGGGAQVAAGAGVKAGYTPIPPNEFASPQLQHHAMANFERNGHPGTMPSSVTLRNGGGGTGALGNGMATSAAAVVGMEQQQRQTRVVLANGSNGGGAGGSRTQRETAPLINAAAAAAVPSSTIATRSAGGHYQQQQHTRAGDEARKRDFKEWYV
uniref:Mucin-5AC n=1 Tax=Globodera rostochiensis TaxID=31243 RepID=A0A914HFP2_GLORO